MDCNQQKVLEISDNKTSGTFAVNSQQHAKSLRIKHTESNNNQINTVGGVNVTCSDEDWLSDAEGYDEILSNLRHRDGDSHTFNAHSSVSGSACGLDMQLNKIENVLCLDESYV